MRIALLLILAYAAFLRLYHLDQLPGRGVFHDEAANGCNVLEVLEAHHFKTFYPENFGREGLYINTTAILVRMLGNKNWVLRLPAAFSGILTVYATYLLGAELFSRSCGLLSAFFISTSFWHTVVSRVGLRSVLAPCFLAFSLYLLLRGMARLRAGKPCLGILGMAGLIYGLGFYTYISYRVTPALMVAIFLYHFALSRKEGRSGSFLKALAAFGLTAVFVVAPLAVSFFTMPSFNQRISQVSVLNMPHPAARVVSNLAKTAALIFVRGSFDLRGNLPGRPEVFWPVAILVAIGTFMGCRTIFRWAVYKVRLPDNLPYAIILAWVILASIPSMLSIPDILRATLMIPPVFLLAGVAGVRSYQLVAARITGVRQSANLASAVFLIVCCYEPYYIYFQKWALQPVVASMTVDLLNLSNSINSLPKQEPKYIVATADALTENGIPSYLLPVAFLTRSYTRTEQHDTNIHYLSNTSSPPDSACEQSKAAIASKNVFCVYVADGFGR
jgi:4-amino-4-deoxy-L-arabinose transferase-like glycosyltransferase